MEPLRIGVLAVQGNFREHAAMLRSLGADVVEVRKPEQMEGLDGLVVPGGESTTFMRLMRLYGLDDAVRAFDRPVLGTCAVTGRIALDVRKLLRFAGITPTCHLHPLAGLQVLVVFEEVLHLFEGDLRQVGVVVNLLVTTCQAWHGHGNDLFIAAGFVLPDLGIAGVVTLEDLLEEIVGEIRDEYDVEAEKIIEEGDGSYVFSAKVNIDEVRERLDVDIEPISPST